MLRHNRRSHGVSWRVYRRDMQHGKEPALSAAFDRRQPGVGSSSQLVARECEDVNLALPYGFSVGSFFYRHRLDERSRATVLALDGHDQLRRDAGGVGGSSHRRTPDPLAMATRVSGWTKTPFRCYVKSGCAIGGDQDPQSAKALLPMQLALSALVDARRSSQCEAFSPPE